MCSICFIIMKKQVSRIHQLLSGLDGQKHTALLCAALVIFLTPFTARLSTQGANGDLDLSFGEGGKVSTFFGGGDSVFALATQADGKIIAVGTRSSLDFAVARYNVDGSLDPTFGDGGKVITDFFGNRDVARAVAIQADGRIIAAG